MSADAYFLVEEIGGCIVITPQSSVGSFEERRVRDELTSLQQKLDDSGTYRVIVDLNRMSYFGSAVLEWMVAVWKQVKQHHGRMSLCNVSETGAEILQSVKFETLWPFYETREQALQRTAER